MIRIEGLTKTYGSTLAVDHLTVSVQPGHVTGFLGPNGSGKSSTMRCVVQLDRPTSGTATINGKPFRELGHPLREVGILLDATYVHPGRTARNHLWAMAASNGLPKTRVEEVLEMVGLGAVATHQVKTFSLGMRQRLGLAGVMLGDPHTVILDEPANGLDPEGIRWIRDFLAHLARQGRTVFVSSHLLSEMSLMADHIVVIGRGRLIEEGSVDDFIARYADRWVRLRSPRLASLLDLLRTRGAVVAAVDHDAVHVRGIAPEAIGDLAAGAGIPLYELAPQTGSLEDAFLALTAGVQDYRAHPDPARAASAPLTGPPAASPPPPPPGPTGSWPPPNAGGR